ncbi:MAG TPA: DMT family transporter [Burkholderiales bacterium]|nr:DMT family transporter [Burkholderiales bacterium]
MGITLAVLSAVCFGIGLVTSRVGLRTLDARSGAAISIPVAAALFALAAPFALDLSGFSVRAALLFAAIGVFFPALVTLFTFRSNEELGPTVTGAVSGTAPLFALLGAALILGEKIPAEATLAAAGVGVGVALLSWSRTGVRRGFAGWALLWPFSGAAVRGLAQVGAKAGLLLWPNPFAAGLIAYAVSSATVVGVDRVGRAERARHTARSLWWFGVTGLLNGGAVLLMYTALTMAPVSTVAPVVATYPLVTAVASAAVLHDEEITVRVIAGAAVMVAAVAYLVASRVG